MATREAQILIMRIYKTSGTTYPIATSSAARSTGGWGQLEDARGLLATQQVSFFSVCRHGALNAAARFTAPGVHLREGRGAGRTLDTARSTAGRSRPGLIKIELWRSWSVHLIIWADYVLMCLTQPQRVEESCREKLEQG